MVGQNLFKQEHIGIPDIVALVVVGMALLHANAKVSVFSWISHSILKPSPFLGCF